MGLLGLVASLLLASGAAHYASPAGSPDGSGTREKPWDIASALDGSHDVRPSDRVLLLAGTYRRRPNERFSVKIKGAPGAPITIQSAPGEHAIIDGGLLVQEPAAFVDIRDLEIFVSEPDTTKDHPASAGSFPEEFKRPWGGLEVTGGHGCRFIDLVIHDCRQGIGLWSEARDDEVYGCVIFDNGWTGVDRGHGHGIYTQNQVGRKSIRNCIFLGGRGYSVHAYGSSKAYVDHFTLERNIASDCGTFLVGGGRPSVDIKVRDNTVIGESLRIGYDAPYNEDCVVEGNTVIGGQLQIERFKKADSSGNTVLEKPGPKPIIRLWPNSYDPSRASLAVACSSPTVAVPFEPFAKAGQRVRLYDPRRLFDSPVLDFVYRGKPVPVPLSNGHACFVAVRSGP